MEETKPQPKGRGALLEKLRKHQEMRAATPGEPVEEKIPPKCRGRAQLLARLMKAKEAGAGEPGPGLGPSVTPEEPPKARVTEVVKKAPEVEKLTRAMGEVSLSEPVTYRGEVGRPLRASANYIRLDVEKDRGVYEYEVRFQPDIDARSNRFKLVNEALGELSTTKVYDGDACLYLPMQLFDDTKMFDSVIPNTDDPVKTKIIFKRKKRLGECLHLYNVLFKRIMNVLLYKRMGRNYFSPDHKVPIPQHKLEVLPGFAEHVDEMEGGLMICLDTQHRVVRSQTVYQFFHDIRAANPRNFKEEAYKAIVGASILTKYNNMSYRIDDIDFDSSPSSTFKTRAGTQCSFVEYYKRQHNITINDVDQPLLISLQPKKSNSEADVDLRICLIPELSYLTGLTDAMRSDFKVMKDVAAYTRVTPQQRALALRTWIKKVKECELAQKILKGWGLQLSNEPIDIAGRVLPDEPVYFGGGEGNKFDRGTDWNRAVAENPLTGPKDFNSWQLYYTRRDQKYATTFAETIVRLGKGMGCIIRQPKHVMMDDDRTETYMTSIRNNVREDTEVAVFICPTLRADRYSVIKKMLCVTIPTPSQVVLSKTLSNPQKIRTIIHKIAMQITCKMGGTLWSVKIPATNWMVCGIDVYHETNRQSVLGFVASTDDTMTRYFSEAQMQAGEIGDFLKVSFRKGLLRMYQRKGSYPAKVIVFRDGVGDGQLEHCQRYEVSQFLEVLKEMSPETVLTYVIVQKRINTRIFEVKNGNYENPPSGSVVDTLVTRRNLKDFYLVPQSVRQGTVNPTHYIILHDDGGIRPDHIQRLAYKLCHLYYNWSGTIRVPAPCLYAHKLAGLVGQSIKAPPSDKLDDKLWFL